MLFVLDASVTLPWGLPDETSEAAVTILNRFGEDQAIVPVIWPLEVANVLSVAERRGRISREAVNRFTRDLRQFPIITEDGDVDTVFGPVLSLARDHNLSAYNASYLELAVRRSLPLATLDDRLRRAANDFGVSLL